MKVEIPDSGVENLQAKTAGIKLVWKEDKEMGVLSLSITANAICDLFSGGTVKSEKKGTYDIHDSPACDAIRAFKRVADLLGLDVDVARDLSSEQKLLITEPEENVT